MGACLNGGISWTYDGLKPETDSRAKAGSSFRLRDYTSTGDLPIATSVTYAYLPSLIALEEGA